MIGARKRIDFTIPAYTVIKAAEAFQTQTFRPNEI